MDGPTAPSDPQHPAKRYTVGPDNKYIYTPLAEVRDGIYNVYGVVTHWTSPRKCIKGSDFIMTVTIVDPSNTEGLSLNLFGLDESKLPSISYVGDIFRAHRLRVNIFNGKPQGVGNITLGYAFIVVNRADGSIQGLTKNATFTPEDKERITALKLWYESSYTKFAKVAPAPPKAPISPPSKNGRVAIENLAPNMNVDLVAQIVKLSGTEGTGTKRRIFASVWDGTGVKSVSPDQKQNFASKFSSDSYFRTSYSPDSPFGALFSVVIWHEEYITRVAEGKIDEGNWYKFREMIVKPYDGRLEGKIRDGSTIVAVDEQEAQQLKAAYQQKCEEVVKEMIQTQANQQVIASFTPHDQVPFSTIQQILSYPEDNWKFQCKVQVAGYTPSDINQFVKPYCSACKKPTDMLEEDGKVLCSVCQKEGSWTFHFVLNVQDETGNMNIIVYHEDATKFLSIEPVNLTENNVSRDLVKSKVTKLLSPNVWLVCCVRSYIIRNQPDRKYRIFDTTLT